MTVAERTREAVRTHPFLYRALRAGVVNYTAAARFLDVEADIGADVGADVDGSDGDGADSVEGAVAVALRRYAEGLPDYEAARRRVRVDMQSGLARVESPDAAPVDAMFQIGDVALAPGDGSLTGIVATGDVGPEALVDALDRLRVENISAVAAGAGDGHLAVAVRRHDGPTALRLVEDAL